MSRRLPTRGQSSPYWRSEQPGGEVIVRFECQARLSDGTICGQPHPTHGHDVHAGLNLLPAAEEQRAERARRDRRLRIAIEKSPTDTRRR